MDDAKKRWIAECLKAGKTIRQTAEECGVTVGQVAGFVKRRKEHEAARPDPAGDRADLRDLLRRALEALEGVQQGPVVATPEAATIPPRPAIHAESSVVDLGRSYERIAFASDFHHPFQDDAAIDCMLSFLADWNPDLFVTAGDYLDCYAISEHDKTPGRADFLQDEFDAAKPTSNRINQAIPRARKLFLEGNHEFRIIRLQNKYPGLAKLRSLELKRAAELPEDWTCYPNQTQLRLGSLTLLHGDLQGRGTSSMHAAKGMLDKLRTTCVFGHLHRFQQFHQTSYDRTVRGGFANGHLCDDAKAKYITSPDWQQGFTTIEYDWSAGIFTVQPHLIVRGRHRWGGRTYAG